MCKIEKIDSSEEVLKILDRLEDAEIYHHPCWKKILEDIFGYKSLYLFCEDTLLPFMYSDSLFSSRKVVSLPVITHGGLIGDREKLPYFLDYLKKDGFDKAVIKQFSHALFEVESETSYAEYRRELVSPEDIWRGFNKGKKSNVNRAKKENYDIVITKGDSADIDRFYIYYLKKMREFGTPPLPKEMFFRLGECFGDKFNMFEIYKESNLLGITICIGFKDVYYYIYVAYDSELAKKYKHTQVYMIYNMMLEGLRQGYGYFSFGRSTKGSPQAKTKRHMGAEERNIYICDVALEDMSATLRVNQQKEFGLAIDLWKMLPIKVTEILGKPVRKFLA